MASGDCYERDFVWWVCLLIGNDKVNVENCIYYKRNRRVKGKGSLEGNGLKNSGQTHKYRNWLKLGNELLDSWYLLFN
jgi:hypothetical protein